MDPHQLAWVGLGKVTTDGRNFLRPTPSPQEAMEVAKDSKVESIFVGSHSAVLI